MKKYLLIGDATGIGGWQLYCGARIEYLSQFSDIVVYMVCSYKDTSEIRIKGFQKAKLINMSAVFRAPYVYTNKEKRKIWERIKEKISYSQEDEVFIEATNITTSLWGEMIAEKTRGTCFAYILQSWIGRLTENEKAFIKFKYDNHLIAGMSKQTLRDMLKGYYDVGDDTRELAAWWGAPICEEGELSERIKPYVENKDTKVIGYFGNLAKPHFNKLCDFLKQYCQERKERSFLFVSIGSSKNGNAEEFQKETLMNISNLISVNIPSMYPVPIKNFQAMDVCIASWGSASAAALAKIITIRLLDDNDIVPQGILGITISKRPFSEQPNCKESLNELLDEILFENRYTREEIKVSSIGFDEKKRQQDIQETINPFSNVPKMYYDITRIKCKGIKNYTIRLLNTILGIEGTDTLITMLRSNS